MFICGLAMVVAGGYLLLEHVVVSTNGWVLFGHNAFGLSLLPLLVGIGFLFFDGRSIWGWGLAAAGVLIIVVGILTNLSAHFRATSLFDTLVIFGLLAGGLGVIARSLRAHTPRG